MQLSLSLLLPPRLIIDIVGIGDCCSCSLIYLLVVVLVVVAVAASSFSYSSLWLVVAFAPLIDCGRCRCTFLMLLSVMVALLPALGKELTWNLVVVDGFVVVVTSASASLCCCCVCC